MRAVQETEFHLFERGDIGHHFDAMAFPGGPAHREIVFHHPLHEWLCHHGPCIFNAERLSDTFAVGIGGCRNNAIHHARREGDILLDVAAQLGIAHGRKLDHETAQRFPVRWQVIA